MFKRTFSILILVFLLTLLGCTRPDDPPFQHEPVTITFISNGGAHVKPMTALPGDAITAPGAPYRPGHQFIAWHDNVLMNHPYVFGKMPDMNTTLYAEWAVADIQIRLQSGLSSRFNVIFAGSSHAFGLTLDSRVLAWGLNSHGQLGDGTTMNRDQAVESSVNLAVGTNETVITMVTGDIHSMALTSTGRVLTWGGNVSGQLGVEGDQDRLAPQDITPFLTMDPAEVVTNIAAGGHQSLALTSNGRLWMWGINNYDLPGMMTGEPVFTPYDMTALLPLGVGETLVAMATGNTHVVILTSNGRVLGWGANPLGQLGDGTLTDRPTAVAITIDLDFEQDERIVHVDAKGDQSLVLTSRHRLFIWGANHHGQTGVGTNHAHVWPVDTSAILPLEPDEHIQHVFSSGDHVMVMTSHQRVLAWGKNDAGQLGDGTFVNRQAAVDITENLQVLHDQVIIGMSLGTTSSYAWTASGDVLVWGQMTLERGQTPDDWTHLHPIPMSMSWLINALQEVTGIASGWDHQFAWTQDQVLWGWGNNSHGQLGEATTNTRFSPVMAPLLTGLQKDESIISMTGGGAHSLGLTSSGQVFAMGDNVKGQIGTGSWQASAIPVLITSSFGLGFDDQIIAIASGGWHNLALSATGRLFGWGWNEFGQVGDGTTEDRMVPVDITMHLALIEDERILMITTGAYHSFAMTSLNRVFAWGANGHGQLGDGTTRDRLAPVDITTFFPLEQDESIIALDGGGSHSLALTSAGRLLGFGANNYGQLLEPPGHDHPTPSDLTDRLGLHDHETIVQTAAGGYFNVVMTTEGRLLSFGRNNHGQLGDGSKTDRAFVFDITAHLGLADTQSVADVMAGAWHVSVLTTDGTLLTWGRNQLGQTGMPPTIGWLANVDVTTMTTSFGEALNLPLLEQTGFIFEGWYLDAALTLPFTLELTPAYDIDLYAKWRPVDAEE